MMTLSRVRRLSLLLGGLAVGTVLAPVDPASGQSTTTAVVQVAPTRVVMSERSRGETLVVTNPTNESLSLTIRWTYFGMDETGELIEDEDRSVYISRVVRYAPRNLTLPPGASQRVRVLMRPRAGTDDGEYRGHLMFEPRDLPPPPVAQGEQPDELAFGIRYRVVVAVPVFARIGEGSEGVELAGARLIETEDGPAVEVEMVRTGPWSSRADINVTADGELVAQRAAVVIYGDTARRTAIVPLPALPDGPLRVSLVATDGDQVLGETTVPR